jgi:hypothetical protein
MNAHNREIILIGPLKPLIVKGLDAVGTVHKTAEAKDADAFYASHANVRAIACSATTELLGGPFMKPFRASASATTISMPKRRRRSASS